MKLYDLPSLHVYDPAVAVWIAAVVDEARHAAGHCCVYNLVRVYSEHVATDTLKCCSVVVECC